MASTGEGRTDETDFVNPFLEALGGESGDEADLSDLASLEEILGKAKTEDE